jgi:hypothetical protein
VNAVEGEVNNGGFHQFFRNNAVTTRWAIEAIEIIGAKNMADMVRRAAAMVPGGMPPKDRFARQDVLLEKYSRAEAFEALRVLRISGQCCSSLAKIEGYRFKWLVGFIYEGPFHSISLYSPLTAR